MSFEQLCPLVSLALCARGGCRPVLTTKIIFTPLQFSPQIQFSPRDLASNLSEKGRAISPGLVAPAHLSLLNFCTPKHPHTRPSQITWRAPDLPAVPVSDCGFFCLLGNLPQIIEKRRRDRINSSLSELRRLVPTAFEKQVCVFWEPLVPVAFERIFWEPLVPSCEGCRVWGRAPRMRKSGARLCLPYHPHCWE